MKEITVPAELDKLERVLAFVGKELEKAGCPMDIRMQVDMAVEELYVNIARYAYSSGGPGEAVIRCRVEGEPPETEIQFLDKGMPYNPLEREDPDVTLLAEERNEGGLGIFLVKKTMDDVSYRYEDGKNILTIKKALYRERKAES